MITPWISFTGGPPVTPGTAYVGLSTHFLAAYVSESSRQCAMPISCKIGGMYAELNTGMAASRSLTVTLRKNGADTPLSIVINGPQNGGYVASDFSHVVSCSQGDLLDLKMTNTAATPSIRMFLLAQADKALITAHPVGTFVCMANGDRIWSIMGDKFLEDDPPTFNVSQDVIDCSGTFSNLYCHFDEDATFGPTGPIWRVTLEVNGTLSSLTAIQSDTNDRLIFDNTHSVHVNRGDILKFKVEKVSGSAGVLDFRYVNTAMAFEPDVTGEVPIMSISFGSIGSSRRWSYPVGGETALAGSSSQNDIVPAILLKSMTATVTNAPGTGFWSDYYIAKNGLTTTVGGRINDTDVSTSDIENLSFDCGDRLGWTTISSSNSVTQPDTMAVSCTVVYQASVGCPNPFGSPGLFWKHTPSGGNTRKICD